MMPKYHIDVELQFSKSSNSLEVGSDESIIQFVCRMEACRVTVALHHHPMTQ